MKKTYTIPNFFAANGTITLTVSQQAALGLGDAAEWDEFWADAEEFANELFPDFNVNDTSTWPAGFSLSNPDSWYILLGM